MSNESLSNARMFLVDPDVSPETLSELENATTGLNVGQTAPLVRVTNLADTEERYIGGLADGDEFTAECNTDQVTSPNVQALLISYFKQTKTFEIWFTDILSSPNVVTKYRFQAIVLQWQRQPGVGEADKLNFTFKISGSVSNVS